MRAEKRVDQKVPWKAGSTAELKAIQLADWLAHHLVEPRESDWDYSLAALWVEWWDLDWDGRWAHQWAAW